MNQIVHKKLGLNLIKKLIHVCLFINKPSLSLDLFNKQTEPKQKILFKNKLMKR